MAKVKSPKLHLSLFTSLQICRPKTPSSMIKSPLPLNYKTLDISFPSPPPSTPSKIVPLDDCGFSSSLPCSQYYSTGEHMHMHMHHDCKTKHKNKSRSGIKTPTSSSKYINETDYLFSSPRSSSHHHPLNTVYEDELFNGVENQMKARRFKHYGSKEWREREEGCEEKRVAPCMKVDQSFVVEKKSVDPYDDFKRSMSEMILMKQIFEPRELEELLMSFLSLNSRLHHKVIIEAFTEILKDVFY